MGKKKSETPRYPHNLGFSALNSINSKVKDVLFEFDKETEWLHELLFECKKAFAQPDIQLLPKTPSVKRRGRKAKRAATCSDSEDVFVEPPSKRLSIKADSEDADIEDSSTPPTRPYRTRGASRTVTTTTRPKRATRTNKTVKDELESSAPIVSMNELLSEKKKSLQENATPVVTCETPSEKVANVKEADTPKGDQIDHTIEINTPKAANEDEMIVQETPEMYSTAPVTPATVVRVNSSKDDTPVNTVEESPPPKEDIKGSRTSIRKSLKHGKTLTSSTRLSSIKRMSLHTLQVVEAEARKSVCKNRESSQEMLLESKVQTPEEKPVRTRTRLRLKKESQNTDSVSSTKSEKSVSSQGSIADQEDSTEDENTQRSTRTKTRKTESKTRTKTRKNHESGQPSTADSDDEVMLISDHEDNNRLSDDDSAFIKTDIQPIRASTRTKQKNSKTSVKTDSENEDSGILSSKSLSETNLPRTRSKLRTNKASANSSNDDQSDKDEPFAKPDKPPPRTRTKTKKRALSDDEADMSLSKKNCMDQSTASDISVGLPISNSTFLTKQDETKMSTDEESSGSDYESPVCPRDKAVRPKPQISTFVHNLNNKIAVANKTGIVKSFIKRNSPAPKLTSKQIQEQKKKELEEKEKKDKERLLNRHIKLQEKIEESRRKHEEKMKKVADAREQKAKREQEMREKIMKKLEEKRQLTEKQREEKAKEDQEKQHAKFLKLQEAEERRRREEEERQQKILIQDEENRMMKEFMARKKETEEMERQRKIMEEKKKHEERMAALERERIEEQEMLQRKEEERQREQQKIREERERQIALEKAEREKQALEQKKQKEQLLKERMEKIKELEKKRLLEEEKRRAELKEREEAVRQIIISHNSNIKNTKEEILKAAMAGLSSPPPSSKPYNPDSYDMTPAKTYKPSTFDTYDISGLKSDDSTDDEDAPKKRIPPWASGPNLKAALTNQHYHPPDLERMFDEIIPPDLNEIFIKKKARFNKRTSSAHWDSPILRPGSVVLNW